MKIISSSLLVCTLLLTFSMSTQAQITPSNSLGIVPPSQSGINPQGKFTAIGESGGAPGGTSTGCNLYGFRAQLDLLTSVNLGIRQTTSLAPRIPTLNFGGQALVISQTDGSVNLLCGNTLAFFQPNPNNNVVFSVVGAATASGGFSTSSDRTLKRNIETIKNPMDIISGLTGYTYEYRRDERPDLNLPRGRRYGFITQEVQKVMPTVVREVKGVPEEGKEAVGYQVMEYDAIIPVLTEAIKLQQGTIVALEARNTALEVTSTELEQQNAALQQRSDALEARLARLEAMLLKGEASDAASSTGFAPSTPVQLGQNRPNPTQNSTVIEYRLPKDMTNAFLVVVDLNGKEVVNQALTDLNAAVELNTSQWTAGTYVYSIVANGNTLASKKMVVQ